MIFHFVLVSRLWSGDHRSEGDQGAGGYQDRYSCQIGAEKGQKSKAASASFLSCTIHTLYLQQFQKTALKQQVKEKQP